MFYHSTLGSRVTKKKKKKRERTGYEPVGVIRFTYRGTEFIRNTPLPGPSFEAPRRIEAEPRG